MSPDTCKIKQTAMSKNEARRNPELKKIKKRVSLHGVALEAMGLGILITGASGIGKTTSAMKAMIPGYFWIADDLAVIEKKTEGILMMTGHKKIQKYLHTEQTGIVEVKQIFPAAQIKNKTRLNLIIDVVRDDRIDVLWERCEQEVLDTRLPCFRVILPQTGYFDQNLLHHIINLYREVG